MNFIFDCVDRIEISTKVKLKVNQIRKHQVKVNQIRKNDIKPFLKYIQCLVKNKENKQKDTAKIISSLYLYNKLY